MERNKNIHVLPTSQPSRLYYSNNNSELTLSKEPISFRTFERSPQDIYITNDEEIKEVNLTKEMYVLDIQNGNIGKLTCKNRFFKGSCKLIGIEWSNKQDIWNYYHIKEIILTTDVDLIKDGVQAIDDEFLEWFVKNPSCEEVEVTTIADLDLYYKNGIGGQKYKIIIPQEEPKQRLEKYSERFDNKDNELVEGIFNPDTWGKRLVNDEPKQETLEEAAEKYGWRIKINTFSDKVKANELAESAKQDFIAGAKWQQERSYSEEDLEVAYFEGKEGLYSFNDWFEQFKNK